MAFFCPFLLCPQDVQDKEGRYPVKDTFSTFDPLINFIFYLGAFLFGMLWVHPAFLACSFLLSCAYYLTIKGRKGWKMILGVLPVFVMIAVINPLFNLQGEHVIFTYMNGRPYTFEALCYGIALGAMFVSVLMWFASYSAVMTSDKFLYLFGKIAPSISLVLTMILRLVPEYQKKITQISAARKCIGKSGDAGNVTEKAENGLTLVSALTSWALEGGIVTADSMRSRGYGSGKRTTFSIYRMEWRDKVLMVVFVILMTVILGCSFMGGAEASYTPGIEVTGFDNPYCVMGTIAYFVFLAIPTVINLVEVMVWRILRSKI